MELRIPGYEDYGVNDEGYVFSYKKGGRRQVKAALNGLLKDRLVVGLWMNGKGKTINLHWLVLNTFHPKPSPELVCRHLNGNSLDNRLCNLQWGTPKENSIDCLNHGTHNRRKLSDQDVYDIRWMLSMNTLTGIAIAEMFGVDKSAITAIKKGKSYGYLMTND